MLYSIQATVTQTKKRGGVTYRTTKQIPTFFLDSDIQGIVDANHAAKIATQVLNPFNLPGIEVSAYAAKQ